MKAFAITGLKETGFVEKDERPVGAGVPYAWKVGQRDGAMQPFVVVPLT